jgi:hypothetical protein
MAGELLELAVGQDKQLLAKITQRVQNVIGNSFKQDGSRVTRAEITRRFHMVELLVRELRSEHGWAFERILDAAPIALRSKLDGTWWDPVLHRSSWSGSTKL